MRQLLALCTLLVLPQVASAAGMFPPGAIPATAYNATPYASPGMEQYLERTGVGEAEIIPDSNGNAQNRFADQIMVPTAPPAASTDRITPLAAVPGLPVMPSEAAGGMPMPQSYREGNFSFTGR